MKKFIPVTLLAVLSGGCFSLKPARALNPSAFYNQTTSKDLQDLVLRLVNENGCTREAMGSTSETSGGSTSEFHGSREVGQALRGSAESVGKLMRALKSELEKSARASGATIGEEGSEGLGPGGQLARFEFEYTAGNGHGQVKVKLEGGDVNVKKGQEQNFKLDCKSKNRFANRRKCVAQIHLVC